MEEIRKELQQVAEGFRMTNERIDRTTAEIVQHITKLDTRFMWLESEVTKLESKVTKLDTKVTRLDDKVTKLDTKVTRLDDKVTKLESKVTKLDHKLDTTRDELRTEIRAVGAQVESHEARLMGIA